MPSEKLKYLNKRWQHTQRTDIESMPLKKDIEAIFSVRNLDDNCETIAMLLTPYRERVKSLLKLGKHAEAVTIFLEILESLTYHFVADEHFCYFDDMYSPDYVCADMMRDMMVAIDTDTFPEAALAQLKEGLKKVKDTEAWKAYGTPYAVTLWEERYRD